MERSTCLVPDQIPWPVRPRHDSPSYTGGLVVLVGSKHAIAKAVRTNPAGRRYAALARRLQRRDGPR